MKVYQVISEQCYGGCCVLTEEYYATRKLANAKKALLELHKYEDSEIQYEVTTIEVRTSLIEEAPQ